MPINVVVSGVTIPYPLTGETGWGNNATKFATQVAATTLQLAGGNFSILSDVNFSANGFGLISPYFKSSSSNIASAGVLRLASTDVIDFRNNANSGNIALSKDSSDNLLWNGHIISPSAAGPVTSITGTAHQVIASASTGAITLSTPQSIDTTSSPTFASLTLTSPLSIANGGTNSATSLSNGAVIVSSSGSLVESSILGTSGGLEIKSGNLLQLDGASSGHVSLGSPSAPTSYTMTLPTTAGTNGYVLSTNGSGVTSWVVNGVGTVNSGTAGNMTLYPASAAAVSDTYVQNGHNIRLGIATQGTRSADLQLTIPNPGDAVTAANMVLDKGNFTIGGTWTFSNDTTLASSKKLILTDNSTNTVSVKATNSTTSYTLSLPTTAGSNLQFLQTDGSGNTSWASATSTTAFREDYVVGTALNNYTGSTTIFNLVNAYNVGGHSLVVTVDGDIQTLGASVDYLETNSTTVTFNNALVTGQKVSFIFQTASSSGGVVNSGTGTHLPYYAANGSTLSDANGQTISGTYTFSGAVTHSATLTMSGSTIAMGSNKITGLANGTVSTDAAAFGQLKVLQTIFASTTSNTSTSSTSFTDGNLTGTITPTSSSNRILILVSANGFDNTGAFFSYITIARSGTNLATSTGMAGTVGAGTNTNPASGSLVWVDSPATTSATTYSVQIKSGNASGTARSNAQGFTQTMILMEVV